jgi:hypothetical protein
MIYRGDGCSWSSTDLHKIYAERSDAETEVTRIELVQMELKNIHANNSPGDAWKKITETFSKEDQDMLEGDAGVEEWEVN